MTNILLVEDDKEIVKNLSLFLRDEGFRVKAVPGQKDALEQIEEHGQEIILSALEYRLLLIFINNKGIVMTRNKLLEEIWDAAGEYVNDNTLTVYIKRLRQKIEDDPQEPVLIRTVRGMGYRA